MNEMIANRYMLVQSIGHGGMADVYIAVDTLLNREVAIKILRGELSNDPVALLRFQREASASTALTHANIVEIYDVGEDNGKHFIVMEYIRGKTLKQLIVQRGALHKEEAIDIMKQLISATMEAHKAGIIHRDIKPQNVLVKDDGSLKMVDFGIALAQDALQLTQSDSVMGSVHYLAPELARGEAATQQSDIYALGIVFYELLTGEVPHHGEAPVQIALKHMRDEIPSVLVFNPSLPQSIDNVIIKSTAKNRAFRYKTAQDMLDDLQTCISVQRENENKVEFNVDNEEDHTIMIDQVARMDGKKEENANKQNYNKLIIAIVSIISALLVILILSLSGVFGGKSKLVKVPELVGLDLQQAKTVLIEAGLELGNVSYDVTDNSEKNKIYETMPTIGTSVDKGSKIDLKISERNYFVIDNYTGKLIGDVKKLLPAKMQIYEESEVNELYPPGTIIRQDLLFKGDKVDPNQRQEIRFYVSAFHESVIPVNIIGMNIYQARALLENDYNFVVVLNVLSVDGMSHEQIEKLKLGVVISCTPTQGTYYVQKEDSYITLSYYDQD